MVDMHKMAFVQCKEFNPESLSKNLVLKPNKSLVYEQSHDRYVSARERVLKRIKHKKLAASVIHFCPNHMAKIPVHFVYNTGMMEER